MKFAHHILSFFLPQACVSCRIVLPLEDQGPFCPSCLKQIKPLPRSLCTICGDPFSHSEIASHICGECLSDRPHFEWARSVFEWGPPLNQVLHAFKYQGSEVALSWFCNEMIQAMNEIATKSSFDVLVPVPLHPFRLVRRGFNQSLLLARGLAQKTGVPVDFKVLIRERHEKPQATGGREERLRQIKGSFALEKGANLEGKRVLLIDDVYTTGATLNECAKVLKRAGAKVSALTLARTLLHSAAFNVSKKSLPLTMEGD